MGLMDKIKGEFVDILEWADDTRDTIVWRFPRHGNEIKMGAKLTVRESQVAAFVHQGQLTDVFTPGLYTLDTRNLPILSTLRGWKHGFNSPFKSEVYFVSTRQFTDLKWGTQNPAMMRDADFGMVRVRAFGAYSIQVADAGVLLRELAGTDPEFTTGEVDEWIRQQVVSRVVTALATSGVAVLDLAAHQGTIADQLAPLISADLAHVGLTMPRFVIENISLPPEVEKAIDTRSRMGALGDLDAYTKLQAADAVTIAAGNSGGLAGAGVGVGLGAGLGAQLAQALAPTAVPTPTPTAEAASAAKAAGPPPLPGQAQWYAGVDGAQVGPFTAAELAGRGLGPDTLVWKAGMAAWTPLRELAELAGSTPPPLPS